MKPKFSPANHPGIAAIYGIEESEGTRALVLELVEGPTLADRISNGPIPIDEALPIAKQIAEALEAAHEAGVIHRDLKPANIKVREDGTVKVLDFGLAKALDARPQGDPSESPTLTASATRMGVIMGTAAYMSPEQASGSPLDKRADIWSFGVVLFEMLTGQRMFTGETVSHVLAAVLKTEPDWTALPSETPTAIARLLHRCLKKERRLRVPDIAVARFEIDDALQDQDAAPPFATLEESGRVAALVTRRTVVLTALSLVVGAILAATMLAVFRPTDPVTPRIFTDTVPVYHNRGLALSPDGTRIVYVARADGEDLIHVRALDQRLPDTLRDLSNFPRSLFMSPDGEWIGYFHGIIGLRKVPTRGGPFTDIISDLPRVVPLGGSWGDDDQIVFATADRTTGLWRVSADGGEPQVLTTPDPSQGEADHQWPHVLPDGRGVLFDIASTVSEDSQIAVWLPDTQTYEVIIPRGSRAHYSPTGHVVYARDDALWAVRFDLDVLQPLGEPRQVVSSAQASFGLSRDGALLYAITGPSSTWTLVWVNRRGDTVADVTEREASFPHLRLSPDDTLAAAFPNNTAVVVNLERGSVSQVSAELSLYPVWTSDSTRLIFHQPEKNQVLSVPVDLSREPTVLLEPEETMVPTSLSSDETYLVLNDAGSSPNGRDILYLRMGEDEPVEFVATAASEQAGRLSERDCSAWPPSRSGSSSGAC